MFSAISRRRFVAAGAAGLASLGDFSFLSSLPSAEAASDKRGVAVADDVEPLVRLIEDTPRDKVIEKVVGKIHDGTTYNELLSALMLAGVRDIRARPVGFEFHCVLAINSAHLAALSAEDKDRWLPLLWAADNFKGSQETKIKKKEGDWRLAAVEESKVPAAEKAKKRFAEAMDAWDEDGADAAVVGLGRSEGAMGVYEQFWRYGARDFRDIGHKAIYVANSWRTLQTIGWRHREPILRSLAFALLDHSNQSNPAKADHAADRPGRANLPRAEKLDKKLIEGKKDAKVGVEVLETLRTASAEEASKKVESLLNKGVHPASIWDGLFLTAGELLMRQPGIVGLHTLTATNALHFGYETTADPTTRAFLLLQAAAFLTMFRGMQPSRQEKIIDVKLDKLEKADLTKDPIAEILADVGKERKAAASKTLALIESDPAQARPLMHAARRLIFSKGTDSHDYKFSSAVLEDYYNVAPSLRPRFLAASTNWLKGSGAPDNGLIKKAREALKG
jgi:hypothetical protein